MFVCACADMWGCLSLFYLCCCMLACTSAVLPRRLGFDVTHTTLRHIAIPMLSAAASSCIFPPTYCCCCCCRLVARWEAGQRLYMKLLLQLYEAAAAGAPSTPLDERCAAAGGVPKDLVDAFRAVLTDDKLDGAFKVRGLGRTHIFFGHLVEKHPALPTDTRTSVVILVYTSLYVIC